MKLATMKAVRKARAPQPRPAPLPIDDIDLPAGQQIICPFPPAVLSPNARVHWSKRSRAAKKYRQACHVLALAARIIVPREGLIRVRLDIFPPDRSRRDDDNVIAAFKSGRDGVADALRVDDAQFRIEPVWHDEPRSCIVVTLLPSDQPADDCACVACASDMAGLYPCMGAA